MAVPNILVIDSDEGFGNMLKEGLENSGYYTATCVHTGREAGKALTDGNFDLIIVDMGLADMAALKFVQAIRKAKPQLKVMMIPLMGQSLPEAAQSLVNGVLTKPFFVGDLPDLIDQAIGRQRVAPPPKPQPAPPPPSASPEHPPKKEEAAAVPEAAPPDPTAIAPVSKETIRYLRANESEVLRLLDQLNREVRAEAILLIAGAELIANAGMLARPQCQELALLVAQSSQAAAQAASFLGEPAKRFAQSLHEGSEYRLYSLTLGEGILLSLALSSNVPLGMIRHQCRQVSEQLSRFI